MRQGTKQVSDTTWTDWYITRNGDGDAANIFDDCCDRVGCAGPGSVYVRRPVMRETRSGVIVITQSCGLDI